MYLPAFWRPWDWTSAWEDTFCLPESGIRGVRAHQSLNETLWPVCTPFRPSYVLYRYRQTLKRLLNPAPQINMEQSVLCGVRTGAHGFCTHRENAKWLQNSQRSQQSYLLGSRDNKAEHPELIEYTLSEGAPNVLANNEQNLIVVCRVWSDYSNMSNQSAEASTQPLKFFWSWTLRLHAGVCPPPPPPPPPLPRHPAPYTTT